MSIIRITEGDNISHIEESWKVFTDEFNAYAEEGSNFTAAEGTVFGTEPEKDEEKESKYIKDGWWSADKEGTQRITEAKVGDTVYFIIEMKDKTDNNKIKADLYDYDGENVIPNGIEVVTLDDEGKSGALVDSLIIKGMKGSLDLLLSPGIERAAEIENNDEVQLYFVLHYEDEVNVSLPKDPNNYLTVYTCDKKVVKSYKEFGYGRCEFYQFRYNDFLRRHEKCGHVPPDYYYGPMIKQNQSTKKKYEKYALTDEMKNPVGMTLASIKEVKRLGVAGKPLVGYSYGFKYCVRFSHVLMPKLDVKGKEWLMTARKRLQQLLEDGVIYYNYEALYDDAKIPILEWVYLRDTFNKNFEVTDEEEKKSGSKEAARTKKKDNFYRNIELINSRFQNFAFATHPDAYDPKLMSELPIKDLALIALSPDFKEWIGEGAYGTWLQAAIVAGEMEYGKLWRENWEHYTEEGNSITEDGKQVVKEGVKKVLNELDDILNLSDTEKFISNNRITHD